MVLYCEELKFIRFLFKIYATNQNQRLKTINDFIYESKLQYFYSNQKTPSFSINHNYQNHQ